MIVSRVVARIKSQQWTAVFIELSIVVLGVFIGIQASNWNAAQVERRKGEEFAERLLQDLRQDLVGRERMVAYYEAVKDSGEKAVELLKSPAPDPKALVVNAYRATEYNFYTMIRATWDELVSSGEIGILPAYVDRDDISTFYTFDAAKDTKDAFDRSPYRQRIRRIIPHAVQQAIRAGCGDVMDEIANVVAFKPDCRLDVSDAEIAAAAAELVNDPSVLADLHLHFSTMIAAVNNVSGDVVLLRRAVASFDDKARRTDAGAKP
jgi:hypothetical protein